jgi:hypothetical protein
MALRGLARMYRREEGLFAFRIRRKRSDVLLEGASLRYTAIALIGLAGEDEAAQAAVLEGAVTRDACVRLVRQVGRLDSLGDVALLLWAASAAGYRDRRPVIDRLFALRPAEAAHPTVEVAWALAALCSEPDMRGAPLCQRLARRLIDARNPRSGMFPHRLGARTTGVRDHISCFADLVYPVHALARHAAITHDVDAREAAERGARDICAAQGPGGQWWWHFDRRTGQVVERYPVYAVHQDAMAPMALFAVQDANGVDLTAPVARGLSWLTHAPELRGGSLIDTTADLIWRKAARREPGKLSRYAQAVASRVHSGLRVPGLELLFPPCAVDYEDRPYHLGWLLHAWPAERAASWDSGAISR